MGSNPFDFSAFRPPEWRGHFVGATGSVAEARGRGAGPTSRRPSGACSSASATRGVTIREVPVTPARLFALLRAARR